VRVIGAAHGYVATKRKNSGREATWFDVAEAYEQGVRFALMARQVAKIQVRNADKRNHEQRIAKNTGVMTASEELLG
jgi:hypothetical protein